MFQDLLIAILYELTLLLKKHPGALGNKSVLDKEDGLPLPLRHYLLEIKEKELLSDLRSVVGYVKQPEQSNILDNSLMKAVLELLTRGVAIRMDMMAEATHYDFSYRKELVGKLIKSDSLISASLRRLLLQYSYQELNEGVAKLARNVIGDSLLILQSPCPIDVEHKKKMRTYFEEKNHLSFPIFQVNKGLIGGLRLFDGGKVKDLSWFARVQQLTSITSS